MQQVLKLGCFLRCTFSFKVYFFFFIPFTNTLWAIGLWCNEFYTSTAITCSFSPSLPLSNFTFNFTPSSPVFSLPHFVLWVCAASFAPQRYLSFDEHFRFLFLLLLVHPVNYTLLAMGLCNQQVLYLPQILFFTFAFDFYFQVIVWPCFTQNFFCEQTFTIFQNVCELWVCATSFSPRLLLPFAFSLFLLTFTIALKGVDCTFDPV